MAQTETLLAQPSRTVSLDLDSREIAEHYGRVGVRQFEHGNPLIAALGPQPGERVHDAGRAEDLTTSADASFDVVYFNSVSQRVADKSRALTEAFRVLKPGGRLGLNSADSVRPHQSAMLLRRACEAVGRPLPQGTRTGAPDAVNKAQLRWLVEAAGFTAYAGATRTFVDQIGSARDLLERSRRSSFGNLLSDLDAANEVPLLAALTRELAPFRDGDGFLLERYLIFATARKPLRG